MRINGSLCACRDAIELETMTDRTLLPFCTAAAMVLALLGGVTGCSSLAGPSIDAGAEASRDALYLGRTPSRKRTVYSKSFQVGERYTVGVGEPLLTIKNYDVTDRVTRAVALQDFEQLCKGLVESFPAPCRDVPLRFVHGNLGDTFDVSGVLVSDGPPAYMVAMPSEAGRLYLLTDAQGNVRDSVYLAWRPEGDDRFSVRGVPHEPIRSNVILATSGPLFDFESDEIFESGGASYLNYDLIYGGLDAGSRGRLMRVIYREYRRDSTDRPIFQQELQYAVSQTRFDILGLRLLVHEATDEGLVFSVVEEALAGDGG